MANTSKGLSFKNITDIIKAGHKAGVQELRFGDLHVIYGSVRAFPPEASQITHVDHSMPQVFSHSADLRTQTEEERQEEEEMYIAAQKLISDPLEHENDLIEDAVKGT